MANSVDRQLLLDDTYSERLGLNTGISQNHPFGGALWRPAEEVNLRSPLYQRLRRYRDYHVYELWNIDWESFIKLPRELTEFILDDCAKELDRRTKSNREMGRQFEQGTKR